MSESSKTFPPTSALLKPKQVIEELHQRCSNSVEASVDPRFEPLLGSSFTFLGDLDAWREVLKHHLEFPLYQTASEEYVIALLNACEGQYRNAFKGLRLVLELCLQGAYLSVDLILLNEWLKGQKDTTWARLMDADLGPLSKRFCNVFFPELGEHVANFREIASALYREVSECIHGNMSKHIPLPTAIEFEEETFELWHSKAQIVRRVVLFSFALRYLSSIPPLHRPTIESSMLDQLGHIEAIRIKCGGPQTT
jgi:hypothetical protein